MVPDTLQPSLSGLLILLSINWMASGYALRYTELGLIQSNISTDSLFITPGSTPHLLSTVHEAQTILRILYICYWVLVCMLIFVILHYFNVGQMKSIITRTLYISLILNPSKFW